MAFLLAVATFGSWISLARGVNPSTEIPDGQDYEVTWDNLQPIPVGLSDATAATVGDHIYLIGGCDSPSGNEDFGDFQACTQITSTIRIYSVVDDSWTTGTSMPSQRYRHASAVHGDDIYVVGGRDVDDNLMHTVLKYSTTAGTWEVVVQNFAEATSDNAAFFSGNMLYTCGGWQVNYTAEAKCFVMDVTAASPSFTDSGMSLQIPRGDHRIVVLDNRAYLLGGFNGTYYHTNTMEVLDLTSSAGWTMDNIAPMIHGRGDFAMVAYNGRILAMGGEDGSDSDLDAGASLRHVEVYDPALNTWLPDTSLVALPHPVFRFMAASTSAKVFIFGGQLALSNLCTCYPTDPRVFSYQEQTIGSISFAARSHLQVASLVLAIYAALRAVV
mmetsp:Transcript_68877/g.128576  ORF Transcript_68877/g.128576 Transcript_68877/m.128576 type:complete len:385 (+) Transcript_68877:60-1214(+)